MGKLPNELQNLVLDYYWSYKMFKIKQKLHYELIIAFTLIDIRQWFWKSDFMV